jgi:hypothetical protein
MPGVILSYQQSDPIIFLCEIDLKKLFLVPKERERFNKNWKEFIKSDPCNKEIFGRKGNTLKYKSEQLIPSKTDNRPPLLLVFGNPASHSVKNGMFFSFEGNKKEHRFWKNILKPAGVFDLKESDSDGNVEELNKSRKKLLLELDYDSPFRIGLCVYISMPSVSNGKWSGIAGVQKLIGVKALRRLEAEETRRIIKSAEKFLSPDGIAVTFQKNAWNGLKSEEDIPYSIEQARKGTLKGSLKGWPHIPLLCVPPTRLSGPCSRVLRQLLIGQGYK